MILLSILLLQAQLLQTSLVNLHSSIYYTQIGFGLKNSVWFSVYDLHLHFYPTGSEPFQVNSTWLLRLSDILRIALVYIFLFQTNKLSDYPVQLAILTTAWPHSVVQTPHHLHIHILQPRPSQLLWHVGSNLSPLYRYEIPSDWP